MISGRTPEQPSKSSPPLTALHPAMPYVAPFVVFLLLLMTADYLQQVLGQWEAPLRVVLLTAVLWVFSRHVIDLRIQQWLLTSAVGVGVFAVWVAPDLLIPGYRDHWLFQNSVTGTIKSSIPSDLLQNPLVLTFRTIRAVVLVPIIEELFWRAWLLRWLISPNFESVELGAYTRSAFWISAILFASEHGPFWEVGLAAGLIYNWLMVRTKSLGDCILAHAITNGVLSLFVMITGRWEYWL